MQLRSNISNIPSEEMAEHVRGISSRVLKAGVKDHIGTSGAEKEAISGVMVGMGHISRHSRRRTSTCFSFLVCSKLPMLGKKKKEHFNSTKHTIPASPQAFLELAIFQK
jgi:hypothetical protein